MNRRSFVLSWGRKLFFKISWPISSLLALIYLRSYIIPQSLTDWTYFVATYLGHFGLLNALVYFLVFCPIALLMPTYYIARFWSLILIISLNLLILCDGLFFSSYHIHAYDLLTMVVLEKGFRLILESTMTTILISVGFFIFALFLWIRGEWLWRRMQSRFSNPVNNWYLVLIAFCLITSKAIFHYGSIHPTLSGVFPLNYNFNRERESTHADNRSFFYPSREVSCVSKDNDNFILITIDQWSNNELNADLMPNVAHMKNHGRYFQSHYAVSSSVKDGLFTLKYSVPASYSSSIDDKQPAFMTELNRRKYEITQSDSMNSFQQWLNNHSAESRPYFLNIRLTNTPAEADLIIQEMVLGLQKANLLKDTYMVITGAYAGKDLSQVPLLIIDPDRNQDQITHVTSHYDLMPSLMQEAWGCKKVMKSASIGKPLSEKGREWLLISSENGFKILDLDKSVMTIVDRNKIIDQAINGNASEPRHELIFEARKIITKFSKPW